jgi:hypothetical protein
MAGQVSGCVVEFALTAEMVINAFSMARQEFYDIVGKAANKSSPFVKVIPGGKAAATTPR